MYVCMYVYEWFLISELVIISKSLDYCLYSDYHFVERSSYKKIQLKE